MENEIEWNHMFDDFQLPQEEFDVFEDVPASFEQNSASKTTNESVESWIEELLMKDDDDDDDNDQQGTDFVWADLLLDSPQQPSDERHVSVDVTPSPSLSPPPFDDKNSTSSSNSEGNNVNASINYDYGANLSNYENIGNYIDVPNSESNGENDKSGDDVNDTDHDPQSKKRKRQLRNRDAAMRSRERKKIYVKDLEMKSRYMEAEVRRLGRLLQCCYAENQMLRISLGSAYGASMANPESAVLLLESLLLVSLVWLMVNMCLPLPRLSLLNQDAVLQGNVERENLESAAPKRKGTKKVTERVTFSFMRSKRCKASRIKMRSDFDHFVLCA